MSERTEAMQVFRSARSSDFFPPEGELGTDPMSSAISNDTHEISSETPSEATGVWLTTERVTSERKSPRGHLGPVRQFGKLVARSPAMHELFDMLERFARPKVTGTPPGG